MSVSRAAFADLLKAKQDMEDELTDRIAALERELSEARREYEGPMAEELNEAHAAIRWLMARFHPYVNAPLEHAPVIRRAMGEGK